MVNQFAKLQSVKAIISEYDNALKMETEKVSITYGVVKNELNLDWNLSSDAEFIQLVLEPGQKAIYGPSVWITSAGKPALYVGNTAYVLTNNGSTIEAGELGIDFSIVYTVFKENASHYISLTHVTDDGEVLVFPVIWGQEFKVKPEGQWTEDQIQELKLVNSLGRKCTGERLQDILVKYCRPKGSGRMVGSMTKMFSQTWLQSIEQPILINFIGTEHKTCSTKDGKTFGMVELKLGDNSHLANIEVTLWNGTKLTLDKLQLVEVTQKSVPQLSSNQTYEGMIQVFGASEFREKWYPNFRVSSKVIADLAPGKERPQLPFAPSDVTIADMYS